MENFIGHVSYSLFSLLKFPSHTASGETPGVVIVEG